MNKRLVKRLMELIQRQEKAMARGVKLWLRQSKLFTKK